MIYLPTRRTKVFRRIVRPAGYKCPVYRGTSLWNGPILNIELKDLHADIRQKKGATP
jgi:hypothetical protein